MPGSRLEGMASRLTPPLQRPIAYVPYRPPERKGLKERVHAVLELSESAGLLGRVWNFSIIGAIAVSTLALILETVNSIATRFQPLFTAVETVTLGLFIAEYALRLWAITSSPRYTHPVGGRLRFAITPLALIDLLAIAPVFLSTSVDLRFLRIARLARVLRVLKLARYSQGMGLIGRVVRRKKEELLVALGLFVLLLVTTSALMYFAEHEVQPKAFSSIPATMWWAVVTMTTLGYGDVYPITVLGRVIAGMTALLGIAAFALPTSILGAGYLAEIEGSAKTTCPRCGAEV